MSVNLSVRQFTQPDLMEQIDKIIQETQINPKCLKLEITESAIMDNETASNLLNGFHERAIKISLDDFGTGYSSLSYLHNFPLDVLKIDQSFVRYLQGETGKMGLVPTIVRIAQTLGMVSIAEGIETPYQLQLLKQLNCDFGQGYLFSRPIDQHQALALLKQFPEW